MFGGEGPGDVLRREQEKRVVNDRVDGWDVCGYKQPRRPVPDQTQCQDTMKTFNGASGAVVCQSVGAGL